MEVLVPSAAGETRSQMEAHAVELLNLMAIDDRVVVLTADLVGSCQLTAIENEYPHRFVNVGVAEQNMIAIAAGLAHEGMIPFAHSFSTFTSMRACEQVRTDLFYNGLNAKVVGTHSGISTGPAGPTHYSIEDIGLIRSMPNSVIVVPADAWAAAQVTRAAVQNAYPMYIRLDRNPVPVIYAEGAEFAIGQGIVLKDGSDPVLFATGVMVSVAREVALLLKGQYGVDAAVIDIHTIKPVDQDLVATYTQKCDLAFTLEEHNIFGGLGSAVAEVMAEYGIGCKLKRFGINDFYPPGGPVEFKRDQLGLSTPKIVQIVTETMEIEQSAHVWT